MVMQPYLTERQKRNAVRRQFELQLPRFPVLELKERLTNYRYLFRLHDHVRDVDVIATVLERSFDFFEYRMNLSTGIGMIICQRHNACVPIFCLELDTGVMYQPGATPEHIMRPPQKRKKRNQEEVRLFVSQLILGQTDALKELEAMPPRTRQHYQALRNNYLHNRIGRPWAS